MQHLLRGKTHPNPTTDMENAFGTVVPFFYQKSCGYAWRVELTDQTKDAQELTTNDINNTCDE